MLTAALRQNKLTSALCAIAISLGTSGCGALNPFAPLPESKRSTSTGVSAVLHGEKSTFTGKVVLARDGYRLHLDDPEANLRLTRAKRASEFGNEEIGLRKYYEKTVAVRGTREGEWIWDADIVGQWNKPGEATGANQLAPPVGH